MKAIGLGGTRERREEEVGFSPKPILPHLRYRVTELRTTQYTCIRTRKGSPILHLTSQRSGPTSIRSGRALFWVGCPSFLASYHPDPLSSSYIWVSMASRGRKQAWTDASDLSTFHYPSLYYGYFYLLRIFPVFFLHQKTCVAEG